MRCSNCLRISIDQEGLHVHGMWFFSRFIGYDVSREQVIELKKEQSFRSVLYFLKFVDKGQEKIIRLYVRNNELFEKAVDEWWIRMIVS